MALTLVRSLQGRFSRRLIAGPRGFKHFLAQDPSRTRSTACAAPDRGSHGPWRN